MLGTISDIIGEGARALRELTRADTSAAGDDVSGEIRRIVEQLDTVRKSIERAAVSVQDFGGPLTPKELNRDTSPALFKMDREVIERRILERRERSLKRSVIHGAVSMEIVREIGNSWERRAGFGDPAAYKVAERLLSDGFEAPDVAKKVNLPLPEVDRVHREMIAEIREEIEQELAEERRRELEAVKLLPAPIALELETAAEESLEAAQSVIELSTFQPINLESSALEQMIFERRQVVL